MLGNQLIANLQNVLYNKMGQANKSYFFNIWTLVYYSIFTIFLTFATINVVFGIHEIIGKIIVSVVFGLPIVLITPRLLLYFISYLKNSPALVLNDNYMYDKQTNYNFNYKDISNVTLQSYKAVILMVKFKEPSVFISQTKNPIKKIFYIFNSKFTSGTTGINLSLLKGNNDEITLAIRSKLDTI